MLSPRRFKDVNLSTYLYKQMNIVSLKENKVFYKENKKIQNKILSDSLINFRKR